MQKSLRCKDSRLGFGILILFGISLVILNFGITRPFPVLGNNGDLRTNGIYGPKCSALSGNCTPLGCLEKMLLASSIWGSTRRFLTWSRQATPLGFSYFLLSPLAHGMSAKELSSSAMLLPTPLASDTGDVGKTVDVRMTPTGSFRKYNPSGTVCYGLCGIRHTYIFKHLPPQRGKEKNRWQADHFPCKPT